MNKTTKKILEDAHDQRVRQLISLFETISDAFAKKAEQLKKDSHSPMRQSILDTFNVQQIPNLIAEIQDLRREMSPKSQGKTKEPTEPKEPIKIPDLGGN